jgi:hypothetical protein
VLVLAAPGTITYERLSLIIPPDQALANKAIQVSLQQIKNISTLSLVQLAAAFSNMQTTRDLPAISALQQAVPASVAAYYSSTYATGSGPNGTLVITDLLGAAVGIPFTSDLTNVTTTINSMATSGILGTLTVTYVRMKDTVDGVYNVGNTVIIPAGPGAGTYGNVDLALSALISDASNTVSGIQSSYPTQSANLNTNFNDMAAKVKETSKFEAQNSALGDHPGDNGTIDATTMCGKRGWCVYRKGSFRGLHHHFSFWLHVNIAKCGDGVRKLPHEGTNASSSEVRMGYHRRFAEIMMIPTKAVM